MNPAARREAVARHRIGLRRRGLVRIEIRARAEDAPLLREVAAALASEEDGAAARALLHARFIEKAPAGLKALLASAPLEDIDLTRPRDLGRDVEF